jgi:hypothetical protein
VSNQRHHIILTGSQHRALLAFLKRVQLGGAEARAFLEIFDLVQNARGAPGASPTAAGVPLPSPAFPVSSVFSNSDNQPTTSSLL